jgi:hypothetical protein
MKATWAVLLLALADSSFAQTWVKVEKTDPLRGTHYVQYSLDGVFLTPPQSAVPGSHPTIIAQCTPGDFDHHTAHGKIIKAYIYVGGVLDSQVTSESGSRVKVQFRLDDGKLQTDYWTASTNFSALFFNPYFPDGGFANMLYGHELPHKQNTSPPIKKVVLGVPEYLGGEVVIQFDMPDPTEVADACGEITHKPGD